MQNMKDAIFSTKLLVWPCVNIFVSNAVSSVVIFDFQKKDNLSGHYLPI